MARKKFFKHIDIINTVQTRQKKAVPTRSKSMQHLAFVCVLFVFSSLNVKADTIPPTKLLNLAPWKLTLPINSSGVEQMGTTAISKDSSKLLKGYFSKYFYGTPDSGVASWCTINGATTTPTAGSNHPRTELTENYQWTMDKPGTLSASLIVNKYPKDTSDIIIGQIHGGGVSNTAAFVMLHIYSGSVIAYVKGTLTNNVGTQKSTLLKNVSLGAKLDYTISTDGINIIITASSPGATGTGNWKVGIPTPWNGITVRFQAGSYVQSTGKDSTDGGLLTFYKLNITHGNPLPISIENFEANVLNNKLIKLNWKMASEKENASIAIERSKDGISFVPIGKAEVPKVIGSTGQNFYNDINPFWGMNYYRLAWQNIDGENQYSKVVSASFKEEKGIIFSQNPLTNTATLHYNGTLGAAFLYNSVGKVCAKYTISKGQNIIYLNKITGSSGIYYLKVEDKSFKLLKP